MSFKKNKYVVVNNVISLEKADFLYRYFLNKEKLADLLFKTRYIAPFNNDWGMFGDFQVPNSFACYGDLAMETLLDELTLKMNKVTSLKLSPTYSYGRIYKKGDKLKRHRDRYSCEVSSTLNLGGDPWSIYLDPTGKENSKKQIKIDLKAGDMLVYKGCDLKHWRDQFNGTHCVQVFMHYNDISIKTAKLNKFDRRPMLGAPGFFKGFTVNKK